MNIMNSNNYFKFDPEKAIESILYITKFTKIPDIYHTLKVLYFADKEHLNDYGRFICGDSYIAMKDGPVPHRTYDIVKDVRDDRQGMQTDHAKKSFDIYDKYMISPLRNADLGFFSISDLECIDEAINKYGPLSFRKLKKLSHDAAYHSADENSFIDLNQLVSTLPDADLLKEHLNNPFPD